MVQDCLFIDFKQVTTKARDKISSKNRDETYEGDEDGDVKSILTVFEPVSKSYWWMPVADYTTNSAKAGMRMIFMILGVPRIVIADNAKSFQALKPWLAEIFGVELHHNGVQPQTPNVG